MVPSTRDTDTDWRIVAEKDPFWGVLSRDEFRIDAMDDETFGRFMASGEQYVSNLFALIRKHLDPKFAPARAFDLGCGVGRQLIPIAKRVTEAAGVDIAPAMLELCQKYVKQAGLSNVVLYQGDDQLSSVEGQFELVNTYLVLQHIPPERGYRLIQSMLERLVNGGVGSIQFTYAKSTKYLLHEQARAKYYRRENGVLIELVDSEYTPPAGTISMYDYDMNQVYARISSVAGQPIITLPTNDDSHLGAHLIFLKARG